MKDFRDRVVVITGAGSGIGRALARRLDTLGAVLVLCDRDPDGLAETAASLAGRADTHVIDVSQREALEGLATHVEHQHGKAHVIINNAGVTVVERAEQTRHEDFEWLMGINFWGVVYGTRAFLPLIRAAGEGAVVNISSVFGLVAWPAQSAYNASKFAVRGYTESLRHELAGTGITAICVHPGGIRANIARAARFYHDDRGRSDAQGFVADFERLAGTSPERAAEIILRGIRRRRPRVLIGADAWLIDRVQRWLPVRYYAVLERLFGWMRR